MSGTSTSKLFIVGICWALILAIGCSKAKTPATNPTVVPKGDRHLGVHIVPAENGDYPTAFALAASAGIDCVPVTIQWTTIEDSGVYDPQGLLTNLNSFYGGKPVSLSLCLSPFGADKRDIPPDLATLSFSDTVLIDRFNRLLDTTFARLGSVRLQYLLIGNEADIYLSKNPAEWLTYGVFARAVRIHAQSLWGTALPVGVETTLGDAIGTDADSIEALHNSMDFAALTYYPLSTDFRMEPLNQVDADFATLFQRYPVRPLVLQEAGYATSPDCSGSDTLQAGFVRKMFGILGPALQPD